MNISTANFNYVFIDLFNIKVPFLKNETISSKRLLFEFDKKG